MGKTKKTNKSQNNRDVPGTAQDALNELSSIPGTKRACKASPSLRLRETLQEDYTHPSSSVTNKPEITEVGTSLNIPGSDSQTEKLDLFKINMHQHVELSISKNNEHILGIIKNEYVKPLDDKYDAFSNKAWIAAGTIIAIVGIFLSIIYGNLLTKEQFLREIQAFEEKITKNFMPINGKIIK